MALEAAAGKPADSKWTDEQWAAIVTEGSNVLVAAAAGSGKTAVLVERIIRKISSNTDVDRLLVATFTKAAAAEMKERITIALEKELERKPESEHLRRQLALMGRASITTLHSFCLDVIRQYYPLIGLDPGFRIANETESELMRLDVLDELFESRYADEGGNADFIALVDHYGGERGDEPLHRLVLQLYDFAQSHPWPSEWLRETAGQFEAADEAALERSDWVAVMRSDVLLALDGAESLLRQALDVAEMPGGPLPYAESLREDATVIAALRETVQETRWSDWAPSFRELQFGKLKPVRGDQYDKDLQEQAKGLREEAKKLAAGLADEWFGRDAAQFVEEMRELAPLMRTLSELVIVFGDGYEQAKRAKGLLDFGDLEHYCLRILRDDSAESGIVAPSAAALEYQRRFVEVLLDEYQDTNMVQEAIVSLIARPGAGNRFMVGDVKQSIYRFRLAEPALFLHKYKTYGTSGNEDAPGLRIDLARNFRSRSEVVEGVNVVFRAIMREKVAELDYDSRAELVCGAAYPKPQTPDSCKISFVVLDKGHYDDAAERSGDDDAGDGDDGEEASRPNSEAAAASELKTAELEARWTALQLKELSESGFHVYDAKRGGYRPFEWRDAVILLRSTQQWAPIFIEQLQLAGIPAYAELGSGYFDAIEVETMLSLLRIVDNPYQDIPLAAVLRSPLFALDGTELALIRIYAPEATYFEAVQRAAGNERLEEAFRAKLLRFLDSLKRWRDEARQGSLAELLWRIYRETGYYDFAGGLPGGAQRQANLRALYDRARQYEATSFRGLFRFLRFIERMRDSGGDLGTARALGEREDVVRVMSIHKSKGLEFPVVFVAGLGKTFNRQDLQGVFLKHKTLGFGPRFVDPQLRISYPSLPHLAIGRAMHREMIAEEMRILYVALTRPKEKLFLVGTASNAMNKLARWRSDGGGESEGVDFRVGSARSYLDWLGPLAAALFERREAEPSPDIEPPWSGSIVPAAWLIDEAAAAKENDDAMPEAEWTERLQAIVSLSLVDSAKEDRTIPDKLEWLYPHAAATLLAAKTSITEMKRLHEEAPSDAAALDDLPFPPSVDSGAAEEALRLPEQTFRLRRPSFMEKRSLTPAERGSVIHLFMQHVPLEPSIDESRLRDVAASMVVRGLLTEKQAEAVDFGSVMAFFGGELGRRMLGADWVRREVPFSCRLPAHRVYQRPAAELQDELVMIQGVIDCLFQDKESGGLVLVDYKTDRIVSGNWEAAAERHRFQLQWYAEALQATLGRPIMERHVFFFDGGRAVRL